MDYESFLDLARSRRSVRRFTDQPVTREQIERLVAAACWAPSNHHRQGWKFVVFEDPGEIQALARRARQCVAQATGGAHRLVAGQAQELVHYAGAFDQAPAIILILHKKGSGVAGEVLASATSPLASGEAISAAMACQNLLLAAHAMGLGACVMTAPLLAGPVWEGLDDLPVGFEPTCLVALGHPAEVPTAPRRKTLEHVIEYRGSHDRTRGV